jgi:apolipoprotein N-acyltransferase
LPKSWSDQGEAFSFALVQPNFPPLLDWDEDYNALRLVQLEQEVLRAQLLETDILMLPEAVTPDAIKGDRETLLFYESLIENQAQPILTGNLAYYSEGNRWYNGIFLMEPETGLNPVYYAKKRLVPFGEYVPQPFQGVLETFGATQGCYYPGTFNGIIPIQLREQTYAFGALICYEDMFPTLVRESVQAGAEILYVATNNVWYGEEGGAYFHAAHSVLRAVENRRPIIRCGNAGWSGWIDAYGSVRNVLTDETNSIYFRGSGSFTLTMNKQWQSYTSVYTRHGDWFVWLSALLAAVAFWIREKRADSF